MKAVRHHNNLNLGEAVETGYFLLPELPGELTALKIPGVLGRITPVSSPYANVVGAAQLDPQSADNMIAAVKKTFADAGLSFGWRVGPGSTPRDLGRRLLGAGMEQKDDIFGLRCVDLAVEGSLMPGLTICKAASTDLDLVIDLVKNAFPYHEEWAPILGKAYVESLSQSGSAAVYLAFIDGLPDPAAFGSLHYLPDRPVVMLSGAATRAAYRRRGIYSCLVAHRLKEARRSGAQAAVMQAVPQSAAACIRLGFSRFCEIEHYIHWETRDQR